MDQLEEIAPQPDDVGGPVDVGTDVDFRPWWQSKLNLGILALAIALLCGGLGWMIGNNRALPDPNKTDIGFLQDMRTHHEQAVLIALNYLARPDTDPNLRAIAREIAFGQSIEIGRMIQLLRQFGAAESNESDVVMSWMNEPLPTDRMPGLATDADISKLAASTGADADKLFADLMIAHHQGGIHMAQFAADHANVAEVKLLAKSMVTGQTGEISELRGLIGQ
jgi:uncharacterized protein (DUF305 family)